MKSLLKYIANVDNLSESEVSHYYKFRAHDGRTTLGYVTEKSAKHFKQEENFVVDEKERTITLGAEFDKVEKRDGFFHEVGLRWRKKPEFSLILDKGWRNELYTVYNPTHVPYFHVERSLAPVLGVITYGVHVNAYVPASKSSNGKIKIWTPRRASNKPTYPGMLDNTVGGGLGYPYGVEETVLKECYEEAGIADDFAKQNLRSVGAVQYFHKPDDEYSVQPEIEYIFDLCLNREDELSLENVDGEAEEFRLMDIDEILKRLENSEFKPNCGTIIIDFLIRHGIVTPQNELNYLEILARSHRQLPFPTL